MVLQPKLSLILHSHTYTLWYGVYVSHVPAIFVHVIWMCMCTIVCDVCIYGCIPYMDVDILIVLVLVNYLSLHTNEICWHIRGSIPLTLTTYKTLHSLWVKNTLNRKKISNYPKWILMCTIMCHLTSIQKYTTFWADPQPYIILYSIQWIRAILRSIFFLLFQFAKTAQTDLLAEMQNSYFTVHRKRSAFLRSINNKKETANNKLISVIVESWTDKIYLNYAIIIKIWNRIVVHFCEIGFTNVEKIFANH